MKDSLFDLPKEPEPSQPTPKQSEQPKVYTVSQVTALIKSCLENTLPGRLTISGQISGFKCHSSGHCYFDIKDENSIIPAVMWKSDFIKLKFKPENGLAILAKGYIDIYPPQGKYQFYADSMQPAGVGELQLAFEQMKNKLEAEGLFSDEHKKPLPKYPFRIAILTSKSGAALHDIVDSIRNRWPVAKLLFYDVPVQGAGAAEKIALAIKDVNKRNKQLQIDIMIVGRGGGSMEDLWAFNEEPVARAIYNSKIPIISAVGHEVDITIADLVADARASTPTKAGVLAVPDINEVKIHIDNIYNRITSDTQSCLRLSLEKLKTILASAVFRNPKTIVQNRIQQLDDFENTINNSTRNLVSANRQRIQTFFEKIRNIEPHRLIADRKININNLQNRFHNQMISILHKINLELANRENRLAGLNPKAVLQRGYSITRNKRTSSLIRSLDDVKTEDVIITELANDRIIESKVTKK
ncbi:MAG: exodeoxyribonuclease VII large subunit [Planctomycetes bacterium GWF2_42_9]|nr:MAG: exodeoxyribonuclease VII large subunit [Planctomycetes bacterium GWF2_42_9]